MSTAAILTGGRARRFGGRAKSLLPLDGRPLIAWQLDALRSVVEHVQIVTGPTARLIVPGLPAVADLRPGAGALGGIYTALVTARTSHILVVACDLPFLTAAFVRHLVDSGREVDVAIPRSEEGYHPLCASYSRTCADSIRTRIESAELKVTDLLADVRVREIGPAELARFDPDGTLLLNVNTPDDYWRARAVAKRRGR